LFTKKISPLKRFYFLCAILFIFSIFLGKAQPLSQEYQTGYASCIINEMVPGEKFKLSIEKQNLTVHLLEKDLDASTKDNLRKRLKKTTFFQHIHIQHSPAQDGAQSVDEAIVIEPKAEHSSLKVLPAGVIYDSPIADPRWPKFSVGYQKHIKNIYGKSIFGLSFGENLALLRYNTNSWSYELGVQAGLFGLMDIASDPTRLLNSDYFVGTGLSIVYDRKWQNLIQLSHTSTHLGDEFLISRPDYINRRINLSYETLKWLTAYKFNSLRPYVGFGYLVHREPAYLKPFTIEVGADYVCGSKFIFDTTQYVLGIHSQFWSENKYAPSLSIRTGLQVNSPVWAGRHLQFLIDYSVGKSRQGQFFKKNEHYVGLMIAISS
jgi:hypothetical protein